MRVHLEEWRICTRNPSYLVGRGVYGRNRSEVALRIIDAELVRHLAFDREPA